jgi:uncharacterized protein (DUF433 family)
MSLEGTVQNGVIILDPGSPPLIRKTPGVIGGDACVGNRRLAVWMLVEARNVGIGDEQLLTDYDPPLTRAELDAAWRYAAAHPEEIAQALRENNANA